MPHFIQENDVDSITYNERILEKGDDLGKGDAVQKQGGIKR